MDRLTKYKKKRWFTESTYVDLATGEVLSKSRYEREDYYTVRTTSAWEDKETYNLKKYTHECRKRGQTKIEF